MVRGGALHSRPPGRLPKRPRPQVHEKGLVPRHKGCCIQASISTGLVELQLGSSQARSGFLWPCAAFYRYIACMFAREGARRTHIHVGLPRSACAAFPECLVWDGHAWLCCMRWREWEKKGGLRGRECARRKWTPLTTGVAGRRVKSPCRIACHVARPQGRTCPRRFPFG